MEGEAPRHAAEALADVGRLLSRTLDRNLVAQRLADSVRGLFDADSALVYRLDVDDQTLTAVATSGESGPVGPGTVLPAGTGAVGLAVRLRRAVAVDDLLRDARIVLPAEIREWLQRTPQRTALAAPMLVQECVTGAVSINTARPGGFEPGQLRLVEAFANLGALALENARLHEQALEASRAKDDFLAAVSHELRTPLTAIVGWVSVLRARASTPDVVRRAVDALERSARAQKEIIDELLDVSKITTGRLRLNLNLVDFADVVRDAVGVARPAMDAKSIHCDTSLDFHVAPVLGDRARLAQVAWHLISNAARVTPRNGRVDVRLDHSGHYARLAVRDTGPGIRSELLPFAFERFRQTVSAPGPARGGLGLGLSIVRHLIELHGGSVRAESAGEGTGATFIVLLPVAAGGEALA